MFVLMMFLKGKVRIRSSKSKVSFWVDFSLNERNEAKHRIDKYSAACNEDIVLDCCDEPRLLLRRNASESPEIRVSIIAGHKW